MLQMPMFDSMPVANFEEIMRHLTETGEHVFTVWQEPESLAFVARGRAYRSEFHINPSHELMHSIKGDLPLHYRLPDGTEKIVNVPEGSCLYQPPLVPHSPRFAPDAFQFVIERQHSHRVRRIVGVIDGKNQHAGAARADGIRHEFLGESRR